MIIGKLFRALRACNFMSELGVDAGAGAPGFVVSRSFFNFSVYTPLIAEKFYDTPQQFPKKFNLHSRLVSRLEELHSGRVAQLRSVLFS